MICKLQVSDKASAQQKEIDLIWNTISSHLIELAEVNFLLYFDQEWMDVYNDPEFNTAFMLLTVNDQTLLDHWVPLNPVWLPFVSSAFLVFLPHVHPAVNDMSRRNSFFDLLETKDYPKENWWFLDRVGLAEFIPYITKQIRQDYYAQK